MEPMIFGALELGKLGVLGGILWVIHRIPHVLEALRSDYRSPVVIELERRLTKSEGELAALNDEVERLPRIWEEERERMARSAERARWHARQSREAELDGNADEPGADEAADVRPGDARGSGSGGVPPVLERVADRRPSLAETRRLLALQLMQKGVG